MKLESSKQFALRTAANKVCHHSSFSSKSQELGLGGPAGVSASAGWGADTGREAAGTRAGATFFSETQHCKWKHCKKNRSCRSKATRAARVNGHRNLSTWSGRGAERPKAQLLRPQQQWVRQRYSSHFPHFFGHRIAWPGLLRESVQYLPRTVLQGEELDTMTQANKQSCCTDK